MLRHITLLLASSLLFLSCSLAKPSINFEIISDRAVIDILQNKSGSIKSINATLGLKPASIKAPKLDAYMSYNRGGLFRLIGLTPTGFTLFSFETLGNQFALSLSDGRKINGSIDEFETAFKDVSGANLPAGIETIKEAIDFYGSYNYPDTIFLIEDFGSYYILSQLMNDGFISYPRRRWWIDKGDIVVVKKEVFSMISDRRGERLFEALYGDFKMVDGILTPFEIVIKGRGGEKLVKIRFYKVEYNKNAKIKSQNEKLKFKNVVNGE